VFWVALPSTNSLRASHLPRPVLAPMPARRRRY
jgi:hypothetical protein